MLERSLLPYIRQDISKKIILLSGPRQCGKTTLSKMIFKTFDYLNFDSVEDRLQIMQKKWDRSKEGLLLDELHKFKNWKSWLKGIYDTEGLSPKILVTGSSRMDISKKMGDSLAGRHFQFQLFPFDMKELRGKDTESEVYKKLISVSGFPEPFLEGTDSFYTKWKKSHTDIILRQDLIDLENIRDIVSIETLAELLKTKTSAPFSYASVAGDLQKDIKTVQRWVRHLENMYVVFTVSPYHKNIAKSILKESKLYFYDTAAPIGDEGVKLENLAALCLKKEVSFLNEALGIESSLHNLRIKGGNEIDFLILRKNLPPIMIEVKLSDDKPSAHFKYFSKYFPNAIKIQIVKNLKREFTTESGIQVRNALSFLSNIDLSK